MRLDTGGGLLGIMVLAVAGIWAIALLPDMIDFVRGVLWWSFGK